MRVDSQLRFVASAQAEEASQRSDPNTEIFVEIRREDPAEEETFEERNVRIGGFLKDPIAEREPGGLAVDRGIWGLTFRHGRRPFAD